MFTLQNLAISTVATAPSPATSGTSLVLAAGTGARFADPASVGPYPVTVWPTGSLASPANAEIMTVTAKSTDTLTIVRAQESSTARTIVAGDQIAATMTAGFMGQFSRALSPDDQGLWLPAGANDYEFEASGTSLPSGWSWVNQGSTTYSEGWGAGALSIPGQAGSSLSCLMQAIPAASSWTATAKIVVTADNSNYFSSGLVLYDSSSGKFVSFGMQNGTLVYCYEWTNSTTTGSSLGNLTALGRYDYMRIVKTSSTSWTFDTSADCIAWRTVVSNNNLSTFFTPTHIGFGGSRINANVLRVACQWFRVR